MSENKKKIAQEQIKGNLSKEDAKKKVAQKNIEEKTGQSFEKIRRLAIDVLEANEGFRKRNSVEAAQEMRDLDQTTLEEFNDKLKSTNLAQELIHAGLGAAFASSGVMALKLGTQRMSEKVREFGDGEQMKAMLHDVKAQHPELTDQDFEQMSPDTLRNLLLNSAGDKKETVQEHQLPANEKSVLAKAKDVDSDTADSLHDTLQEVSHKGAKGKRPRQNSGLLQRKKGHSNS